MSRALTAIVGFFVILHSFIAIPTLIYALANNATITPPFSHVLSIFTLELIMLVILTSVQRNNNQNTNTQQSQAPSGNRPYIIVVYPEIPRRQRRIPRHQRQYIREPENRERPERPVTVENSIPGMPIYGIHTREVIRQLREVITQRRSQE